MEPTTKKLDMKTIAWAVYGCWAAGILSIALHILGILPLVGLAIAVLKKKEAAGTIYESHFEWVIRTFIIGIIAGIIGSILMFIPFVGMAIMAIVGLWGLWRLVKGAMRLNENKPIENPKAFY